MRAVIQRVNSATVYVDPAYFEQIGQGLLVLIGIEDYDTLNDAIWLANKIIHLRVFGDEKGLMNLSVLDVKGEIMVISQFTLYASTRKGNRPSFIRSAGPEKAIKHYNDFIDLLNSGLGRKVREGKFGKHMDVSLVNSGPVTIIIDTKLKE